MITAGITALHEKRDDNPFGTPGLSQFFLYYCWCCPNF